MNELHEKRHLFINELCKGQNGRQSLSFIKGQKHIDQMTKKEHMSSVSFLYQKIYQKNTYLAACVA